MSWKEIADPLKQTMARAQENLSAKAEFSASDIVTAFEDKDLQGRSLTACSFVVQYFDTATAEMTHSRTLMTTMNCEVEAYNENRYTSLAFTFPDRSGDLIRLWDLLEDFGKKLMVEPDDEQEYPVLAIFVTPLTLGGNYFCLASGPVFHCLQSDSVERPYCNQIRLMFAPETVTFLHDSNINTEDMVRSINVEFAARKLADEQRAKKKAEEEAYQKAHEEEIAAYRETLHHHVRQPEESAGDEKESEQ